MGGQSYDCMSGRGSRVITALEHNADLAENTASGLLVVALENQLSKNHTR